MKKNTLLIALIIGFSAILLSVIFIYPLFKKTIEKLSAPVQILVSGLEMGAINEEFIETYNPPSQKEIDVLHYKIMIDLFPNKKHINGDVTITMLFKNNDSKNIDLNFYDNLEINQLFLNEKPAVSERTETLLRIKSGSVLNDTVRIRVIYSGQPHSLGFGSFNFDEMDGKPFVYTLNEPVFASTWFPCIDSPDDKALLDIFITNDSSNVSLSNGILNSINTLKDRRTYHWKTIYPISTYLISIYSGNYKSYKDEYISLSGDTLNLFYYSSPQNYEDALKDFQPHKRYLEVLESIFGPYPFIKEKYAVAEFTWVYGAMENQTITGIGSRFISGKRLFQDMLIHELAHHWWGNSVGPKTWKDIWLNEGFATYSEALYWEKYGDFSALQSTMNAKFGNFSKGTLYNPGSNIFSRLVYDKGAWVLHMLRKETGDSLFFKILSTYYDTYKYSNASTEDFKNICQKVTGKNLGFFFDQWVYKGEGIINLQFNWKSENVDGIIKTDLQIKQLQNGYDIYKFPLDIKIFYENGNEPETKTIYISSRDEIFKITTKHKPITIELDPDRCLLAEFINK